MPNEAIEHSLIIPVYRNEENVPALLAALAELAHKVRAFEVIFVVDGSPDRSADVLAWGLQRAAYCWQLVELSRNFGSFAAIRQGLGLARGKCFAVMAADLQEPPELMAEFFDELDRGEYDVVVGARASRDDPPLKQIFLNRLLAISIKPLLCLTFHKAGSMYLAAMTLFEPHCLRSKNEAAFSSGKSFGSGFDAKKSITNAAHARLDIAPGNFAGGSDTCSIACSRSLIFRLIFYCGLARWGSSSPYAQRQLFWAPGASGSSMCAVTSLSCLRSYSLARCWYWGRASSAVTSGAFRKIQRNGRYQSSFRIAKA